MKLRSPGLINGEHFIELAMTISTITAFISADFADSLIFVGSLSLLILLFLKELVVASADSRLNRLSRVLDASLPPLLVAFFLVMIFKVTEVMG